MRMIEDLNSVYEKLDNNLGREGFEVSINSDRDLVLVKQKNSQYLGELTKNCLLTFTFGFNKW